MFFLSQNFLMSPIQGGGERTWFSNDVNVCVVILTVSFL